MFVERISVEPGRGAAAVELFMRPRSVAVLGVSAKPGTAGRTVLANLRLNGFAGDVHVVGRSAGEIDGHDVKLSVDDLPEGVDLAVFTLPAGGVKESLEACARRGVRAVTIFSSGFAEVGNKAAQDELAAIAANAGIALLGPNCLGYTNLVDGLPIGFANARTVATVPKDGKHPAVAMVSQSGGLMAYASLTLAARALPVSYTVATGNEAGVGIPDFIDFFVEDPVTRVIALYLEEVRDPQDFLAAAARARAAGKSLVAIHPGRGEKGKAAVQSHTGALAGDYEVMRTHFRRAGVVLVDTLEEWVDVIELLARYPEPPTKGPGVLTFSGGFCAIAHDFFEDLGLEMPSLTEQSRAALAPQLPSYIPPRNPLDLGTQAIWQPELTGIGTAALVGDEAVGSVLIAINSGTAKSQANYGPYFVDALKDRSKPAILGFPAPELNVEFEAAVRDNGLILSRSLERSMRALARVTHHGRDLERAARSVCSCNRSRTFPRSAKARSPNGSASGCLPRSASGLPMAALRRVSPRRGKSPRGSAIRSRSRRRPARSPTRRKRAACCSALATPPRSRRPGRRCTTMSRGPQPGSRWTASWSNAWRPRGSNW